MSDTKKTVLAIVAGLVALFVLSVGWWGFRVLTADVKGAGDQVVKTKGNADYRIAAYDKFYDLCGSVQAKEDQIGIQTDLLATSPESDAQRLRTNIAALKNSRASLIRTYNADASKAGTRGDFLASDLPYSLTVDGETTCAR